MTATTTPDRTTRPSADPTRDRILAAALDLFSERSFDGATLREIAQRAGVTQPLLHYHYRSKDELWRAAVDSLFAELRDAMAERTHGLRGVDELTAAKLRVREFITFSARHPQLHRIITQESKSDGARMEYLVEQHVRPLYVNTVELFERLTRDGLVAAHPAAAPLLHPHRRRPDDVRARARVRAAERPRSPVRRGDRCACRRRLHAPVRRVVRTPQALSRRHSSALGGRERSVGGMNGAVRSAGWC